MNMCLNKKIKITRFKTAFVYCIFCLLVCFEQSAKADEESRIDIGSKNCETAFSFEISDSKVQEIFSASKSYTIYKGQKGYLLFAKRTKNTKSMDYIFIIVSRALGKNFKKLGWRVYRGYITTFQVEKGRILDENGMVKEEYVGPWGYVNYTEKYYKNDKGKANMFKAYINVSSVLEKRLFVKLRWRGYNGSTKEFRREIDRILYSNKEIKMFYIGGENYARYAEEYYEGDMIKTYKSVSAVLDKEVFKKLQWQEYRGSADEFKKEKAQILNENGELKSEYIGIEGLVLYAKTYYINDKGEAHIEKAYSNVSAVLDKEVFKKLQWQKYCGSADEFEKEKAQILDENGGGLRENYMGIEGYANYAEEYYEGDMIKTYKNVSVVFLDKEVFKKLKWRVYHGFSWEFRRERKRILNKEGQAKSEYIGIKGLVLYAKTYYEGNMSKAFQNVSGALGGIVYMNKLGLEWLAFRGNVDEYQALVEMFERHLSIYNREELKGPGGQKRVAKKIFKDNVKRAYENVSAFRELLLGSRKAFTDLGWDINLR